MLINRLVTFSFSTYNFSLFTWLWSWKLNISYFLKCEVFYVLFKVTLKFFFTPNKLLYALFKVFISKKMSASFPSAFWTIFMISISAISLPILSVNCIVSSFSEATFLWKCIQHIRWYCTSLATTFDTFGAEHKHTTDLVQKASLQYQAFIFSVSLKAALRSFPPGFWHNMQLFLWYREVVERSNLGVSEKDLDCWVSSVWYSLKYCQLQCYSFSVFYVHFHIPQLFFQSSNISIICYTFIAVRVVCHPIF